MRGGVQYSRAAAGEDLNLGSVGRAIWRKKFLILGSTLVVAAAAYAGASMLTPRYKSEARVLIEGRENVFLRPEAEKTMNDRGVVDPETVTSQVQLILSRDLARDVIKELNLTDSPEFNPALRESSSLSLLRTLGIVKDPMSMAPEERVLAAYYDRLTAYAIDKSRVISIEFQSADPDLAARGANLIAKRYLTLQQMAKQDQARSAGQWLSGELEKLRGKVTEAEAKVENFRAKSNLYIGSNNTSLSNQQLTELSSQVSAARAQKADAEVRARSIREALSSGRSLDSADIATSELIRRLSEQRVTLKAQLAEQSSTLLPKHPRIKELNAQIADLEQQIRTEGDRMARSFERQAQIAGARLEALSANLDQFKRQTASSSGEDVQLRALEREAKAQRDLFESYLAKYRETTARDSIAAAPADARIISSAVVSNVPYFPKKTPITLIAALGTFCLVTAFVVTSALLNGENYGAARRATDVVVESEPVIVPEPVVARAPATAPEPVIVPEPVVVPEPAPAPAARSVDIPTRADDRSQATAATSPEREASVLSEHAAPVLSEPEPPMFREPVMPAFPKREAAVSPEPEKRPFDEAPMRAVPEAHGIHEARDIDEAILGDLDTPEARAILERTAPRFPKPAAPPLVPESAPQPANTRVDDIAAALRRAGAEGRSVAVIGSARNVGTTVTSIALARALARTDRVVLVDLAFSSAHVDPLAEDSNGPGVAELLRGEASFGDVIIRDPGSRAHLVTAGRVGGSAHELLESDLLWDAVEALAQSYDYLVIDAGVQSEIAPAHLAMTTPYAVLVCGDTPVVAITALAGELQQAGFVHVAIMSGSPPSLEEAAAQTAA